MKLSEINWRLIILAGIGAAIFINAVIILLFFLFYSIEIFDRKKVEIIEFYYILFGIFSPLIASLISSGIVTFFRPQRKFLHLILSTLLTFTATVLILGTFIIFIGSGIYLDYDRRNNRCYYEDCKE